MKYEKDQWVIYQGVPHYIKPINDIYIPEDKMMTHLTIFYLIV